MPGRNTFDLIAKKQLLVIHVLCLCILQSCEKRRGRTSAP